MAFIDIFWATYLPFLILIAYLALRSGWCALHKLWDRADALSLVVRDLKKQGLSFAHDRRRVAEDTGAHAAWGRIASSACRAVSSGRYAR